MMKPMKVKQLINLLKTLDAESLVVLAKDSEGNGYSIMENEQSYCEAYIKNELGYLEDIYSEEDKPNDTEKCVVLWPSN